MRAANESRTSLTSGRTSEAVVMAVADAKDVEPTELRPLNDVVDPDALDTLFQNGTTGELTFEYEGHHVVVTDDGGVFVNGHNQSTA